MALYKDVRLSLGPASKQEQGLHWASCVRSDFEKQNHSGRCKTKGILLLIRASLRDIAGALGPLKSSALLPASLLAQALSFSELNSQK